MSKKRFRTIPQRTKTKDEQRSNYFRTLGARPVSGTTQDFPKDKELEKKMTFQETGDVPEGETDQTGPGYKGKPGEKSDRWKTIKEHSTLIGSIIAIIIFIATIVTLYNNLTNKIDNVKDDLSKYQRNNDENVRKIEKDFKEDIRYITGRIDKYISKKP